MHALEALDGGKGSHEQRNLAPPRAPSVAATFSGAYTNRPEPTQSPGPPEPRGAKK
jgi:hypothetical protein